MGEFFKGKRQKAKIKIGVRGIGSRLLGESKQSVAQNKSLYSCIDQCFSVEALVAGKFKVSQPSARPDHWIAGSALYTN